MVERNVPTKIIRRNSVLSCSIKMCGNFCGSSILQIGDFFFVFSGNRFLRYDLTEIYAGN